MPNHTSAPTETNHTAICLIPGLELMVPKGRETDPIVIRLVESCRGLFDADDVRGSIEHTVALLVSEATDESYNGLVHILESIGWFNGLSTRTHADLADAIRALLPLALPVRLPTIRDATDVELHKAWGRGEAKAAAKEIA